MNTQKRKIAGFMSAESIYSLAFYIIMVAAIAGVGASVLTKKDAAKAVAAISLLRANFVADSATLGSPAQTAIDGAYIAKMSGNLIAHDGATPPVAHLSDGSVVSITVRSAGPSYSINVVGLTSAELCNAIGGVGWGTWTAFGAVAGSTAIASNGAITNLSVMSDVRDVCDAAPVGAPAKATLTYGFNI